MDYELTFITGSDDKTNLSAVEQAVAEHEGAVGEKNTLGKRDFAYPISRLNAGYYHIWKLKIGGERIDSFKKKLNLENKIIRYLLLKQQ